MAIISLLKTVQQTLKELVVVDHEGNIVFENVGKVKAQDLHLKELKNENRKFNATSARLKNAFQIQITNFASQKALSDTSRKANLEF